MKHEINIQESSINQKPNSATSIMFYAAASFIKKSSCLVARIV